MAAEESYEMAYPFVVCQTNGGPYDDTAFVAGAQFGQLAAELRLSRPPLHQLHIEPALVPQVDLLAMHVGYTMTAEPSAEYPEEWVLVTLRLQAQEPPA